MFCWKAFHCCRFVILSMFSAFQATTVKRKCIIYTLNNIEFLSFVRSFWHFTYETILFIKSAELVMCNRWQLDGLQTTKSLLTAGLLKPFFSFRSNWIYTWSATYNVITLYLIRNTKEYSVPTNVCVPLSTFFAYQRGVGTTAYHHMSLSLSRIRIQLTTNKDDWYRWIASRVASSPKPQNVKKIWTIKCWSIKSWWNLTVLGILDHSKI